MEGTSNPNNGPAINVEGQEVEKDRSNHNQQQQQHIILFYKYHPISNDKNTTNIYLSSLEKLCQALSLKGRILVAFSETEGVNGTLSGDYPNVLAFTHALLGQNASDEEPINKNLVDEKRHEIVKEFWDESKAFFDSVGQPVLQMNSPEDFKWSRANSSTRLFPDLNIKLVKELIGTGGVLSSIPLEETAQGYLTPQEWHAELSKLYSSTTDEHQNDAILIDCRNTKESAVGHFQGAIDPNTTTFAQFPKWVENHKHLLENKRVFMYCTGGIRCEKASAYVRRQVPSVKKVQHLKGGIHKYLEAINDDNSHWRGRNFVFHADVETQLGCEQQSDKQNDGVKQETHNTVGKCIYCQVPYDQFDPQCVCTVCREPTLTCPDCQKRFSEFHCKQHFHLRSCYFTNLSTFTPEELRQQWADLQSIVVEIAVGKRFKQKRKTLHKQCEKIRERLVELENGANIQSTGETPHRCRNCDHPSCSGKCWGFYSLKRKEILEQKQKARQTVEATSLESKTPPTKVQDRKRSQKEQNRDRVIKEFEALKLSRPPCCHRDPDTAIRLPPPCTRILQTKMKGKWKGKPVLEVVKEEFMELSKPGVLECVLENRLLRVNGNAVTLENAGAGLMTGDTISRVVHWHEPPVIVPERISVQKVPLPDVIAKEFGVPNDHEESCLFICNKPSSVPVHPAGPFLSNSLTMMVEAQEKLPPQSLIPCHRTDRVTSGLTICCTNTNVARIVQRSMCEHHIQKLYLARVHGQFPGSGDELCSVIIPESIADLARRTYVDATNCIKVEAPIETVDPAKGIRRVTAHGKPASSLFQFLSYDPILNVSLVACRPITGRSHQLRVHLQLLGFPILNDVLYGGRKAAANDALTGTEAAVKALMQSTMTRKQEELKGLSVTDADADRARSACALCKGIAGDSPAAAAKEFFTPAQLLENGHSIDLHAFQYRIEVFPKETKIDVVTRVLGLLELKVDNPIWAEKSQTANVSWLEETV